MDDREEKLTDRIAHRIVANRVALAEAQTELAVVRAHLHAALAELRRVEWVNGRFYPYCPSCDNGEHVGHAPDCSLAAVLARAEGREH